MPGRIRKCVHLDPTDLEELKQIATEKGGRPRGHTLSSEIKAAIREYIKRNKAQHEEASMTPVWQQLLDEGRRHLQRHRSTAPAGADVR